MLVKSEWKAKNRTSFWQIDPYLLYHFGQRKKIRQKSLSSCQALEIMIASFTADDWTLLSSWKNILTSKQKFSLDQLGIWIFPNILEINQWSTIATQSAMTMMFQAMKNWKLSYLLLEVLVQALRVLDSKLWEIPRFLLLKSTRGGLNLL